MKVVLRFHDFDVLHEPETDDIFYAAFQAIMVFNEKA